MSRQEVLPGREFELGAMGEGYQQALRAGPQLVLFEGERGLGRTALLDAFADALRSRRRPRPAVMRLAPPDGPAPYEPVRHAALATDPRLYRRLAGARQGRVVQSSLVAEWLGAVPGWGDLAGAVAATADAVRRRRRPVALPTSALRDEAVEALHLKAVRHPVVLLLDDLDRAPDEAVEHLARLISAGGSAAVFVVGATLPAAPGGGRDVAASLRRAIPGDRLVVRRLGPLAEDVVAALVAAELSPACQALVPDVMAATGGHPAAVRAVLDQLRATDSPAEPGRRLPVPLPGPVCLPPPPAYAALPHAPRVVVAAGAAEGMSFSAATLAERLGRAEVEVEDQLAVAVHTGCLLPAGEAAAADGQVTSLYRFPAPHYLPAILAADRAGAAVEADPSAGVSPCRR